MKLKLPRRLLLRIVGSIVGAYLLAMGITWALHDRLAEYEARTVLERVLDDVQGQIEDSVNGRLVRKAMIVREWLPGLSDWSAKTMQALAEELRVDEICVADATGVFVASTCAEDVGVSCQQLGGQVLDFLCLLDDKTEFAQKLQPNSRNGTLCKYVGVWRPEGGFAQVGWYLPTMRRGIRSRIVIRTSIVRWRNARSADLAFSWSRN